MNKYFLLFCILSIFLTFSSQGAESASSKHIEEVANTEAIRAANKPKEFNDGIKDISAIGPWGAMTLEMAKFYMAVAAVDFTKCILKNDPTQCQAFIESLKDPAGHVGFALFMKSNHLTVEYAHIISRGKINPALASYLGLASGMMVQSIFQEIYYHPRVQELFRVNRIENKKERIAERKRVLNLLWKDFIDGSGSYLFNKIPNVLGLVGTAYVAHQSTRFVGKGLGKSKSAVKFVFNKKTSSTIIKYGKNLAKQRNLARAGIKFVWNGSKFLRIHPVVAVGSVFVETVIFLLWAPVVEGFVVKQWDRSKALGNIKDAEKDLNLVMLNNEHQDIIRLWGRKTIRAFDEFRNTIMHDVQLIKARHTDSIQKVDIELQKTIYYYGWLASGMDRESIFWKDNQLDFHSPDLVGGINQSTGMAEHFFCGDNHLDAVERKIDIGGMVVPFSYEFIHHFDKNKTYYENMLDNIGTIKPIGIELSPFKVYNVVGLCEKELKQSNWNRRVGPYDKILCPVNYNLRSKRIEWKWDIKQGTVCRIDMQYSRHHILRTGRYKGRNIRDDLNYELDTKLADIMEKVWTQRDIMILRYEKSIRESLLEALSGRDVEIIEHDGISIEGDVEETSFFRRTMPLGLIPNYQFEINYWYGKMHRFPKYTKVFMDFMREAQRKKQMAETIFEYTKTPYRFRVRESDFIQNVPKEDWQMIVRDLKSFIMY